MRALVPALAAVTILAGCVAPAGLTPAGAGLPFDPYPAVAALVGELPCEATEVGEATSENLKDLTAVAYAEDAGIHGEIDALGDWLVAARYQTGGLELVSLADPAAPRLVATHPSEEDSALDVKFLPDGRRAIIGHVNTIEIVDLAPAMDGTGPIAHVSEWEYPTPKVGTNMHMLAAKTIADETYVFVAPNDDTGVWILKLAGDALETVTNTGGPLAGGPIGPHDMSVFDDETLGVPVLYVANGFEGWLAYDVSDPAAPKLLAAMPNLDPGQGYTHTIGATTIDGRRLVVTIAEVGVNMMKIYDATDFARPVLLAEWWADKTAPNAMQHNLNIVAGTVFVAHYGYGVFAFDLTTVGSQPLVGTATIAPVAHYNSEGESSGSVWDVVVKDGLLYVGDIEGPTKVVAYGCFPIGDAAFTSTA